MILALTAMSAGWQAFCYIVAVVAFVAVVVWALTRRPKIAVEWALLGAGLLFFALVFAWQALAAA